MNRPAILSTAVLSTVILLGLLSVSPSAHPQSPPSWNYRYDAQGNLTQIQDGRGQTTDTQYDRLHRPIRQTGPAPAAGRSRPEIHTQYDGQDQLTQVIDPRQLATRYTLTGLGTLTTQASPDTGNTVLTYDAAGNWKTRRDARGVTTTATWDALNRLTQLRYSGTGFTTLTDTYQYDQNNAIGQRTAMSYSGGQTTWTYDRLGRLSSSQQRIGNLVFSTQRQYDSAGRLSRLTLPSGKILTYDYNAAGQIQRLSVDDQVIAHSITYAPFSAQPISWIWGNGQAYQRELNSAGQLIAYPLGPLTRRLSYDAAGRLTGFTHTDTASGQPQPQYDQTYQYDDLDRLTQSQSASSSHGLDYDASGNRTHSQRNGQTSVYQTDPNSNRLSQVQTGTTNTPYTYDASGNLQSDGTRTYRYDARGRLSQVVVGSSTTTYLYDGLGQRIRKSGGPAGTVHYVYAAPGQLLGQYNASGQAVQEVVWLDDLPLALLSTQETIRDNTATGTATGTTYVGTWSTLTSPHGYWGSNYRSAAVDTSAQPASATWRLNVSGSHKLYARWPVQANASAQASYQIQHNAGSTTVRVDQRQDGTAWVYLGQYLLSPSSLITLSAQPDGVVAADAIKAVSTNEAARVFYVHSDHLNTPRTIVNTQGQLRWRWLTEPWGQQPPEDNPSNLGVFTTALRLPGQLYDVESTLHYNTYRDYFPDLGRYLQSDPIGLQGGINTYSYVNGNPVSLSDPLGLFVPALAIPLLGGGSISVGSLLGITVGVGGVLAVGSIPGDTPKKDSEDRVCKPAIKPCPPCKTVSGKIVPVGTIGYRPMDTPSRPQHGITGSHFNIYKANQNPNNCQCFWQSVGAVPPSGLPAGAIPIEPFAN